MDTLGKEKADVTHIKHNLNPQDARKVKSDNESDYKSAGAHDRQSQDNTCRYKLRVVEDHEEKAQLPKVDVEGDWKTWMSKNLQSKRCNKLMGRQSIAANSTLKDIMGDEDILSQSTPKRAYTDVTSSQKAFHCKPSDKHIATYTL